MPSSLTIYAISIANTISGTTTHAGFIDNKRLENYNTSLATTPAGLTNTLSQDKRRGNLRYREIINQLQMVTNCYVLDSSFTGTNGAYNVENSAFSFQMYVERGDAAMTTRNELVPGTTLTGIAAIKRCVARALTINIFQQIDVFDPTSTTSLGILGATKSVPRYGVRIMPASSFEMGSYQPNLATAESYVTVTALM